MTQHKENPQTKHTAENEASSAVETVVMLQRRCSDYDHHCELDARDVGAEYCFGCFLGTTSPYPADGYCPILNRKN